jgi:branched-chain amino acid aminotransferase
LVWCDGKLCDATEACVSALDRTLLYGLGAFETFRLHGGRPFMLDRHLERMRRTLESMGLAVPASVAELPDGVVQLAASQSRPSALCRVTVTAGAGPDAAGGEGSGQRVLAMLRDPPGPSEPPVRVGLAPFAVDARSPISGLKSTSYLTHYLQREKAERSGRVDDLMLDRDGCVAEGTVSNVFVVRKDELHTPPLLAGILPGVTRGVVMELASASGITVVERPLPLAELAQVDELFLTGAGKCLVGVDEIPGRSLPADRPVTTALRRLLAERIAEACGVNVESVVF